MGSSITRLQKGLRLRGTICQQPHLHEVKAIRTERRRRGFEHDHGYEGTHVELRVQPSCPIPTGGQARVISFNRVLDHPSNGGAIFCVELHSETFESHFDRRRESSDERVCLSIVTPAVMRQEASTQSKRSIFQTVTLVMTSMSGRTFSVVHEPKEENRYFSPHSWAPKVVPA